MYVVSDQFTKARLPICPVHLVR